MNIDEEITKVESTINYLKNNEPFERCFEAVPETYRGVESGNTILPKECHFCRFKRTCWTDLKEIPSLVSKAKEPPIVEYVTIA